MNQSVIGMQMPDGSRVNIYLVRVVHTTNSVDAVTVYAPASFGEAERANELALNPNAWVEYAATNP